MARPVRDGLAFARAAVFEVFHDSRHKPCCQDNEVCVPAGAAGATRFFSDRRIPMKIRHALLVSTLLAASSLAMAQGAGGGGGPAGNDPSGGTNAGATREGGDMQASGATAHKSKKHMKHTKKPATDTTNTPGADASSDTKGQ
jgi:hypothetical protein